MFKAQKQRKRGTIKDFKSLPKESLAAMKEDLGLYTSVEELVSLQKSFTKTELTLDGLYLLDSLSANANIYPERICVGELKTNDRAVIDTYTDLVAKRKEADKGKSRPVTLISALSTASEYLRLAGKELPLPSTFAASVEDDAATHACMGLYDSEKGTHVTANGEYPFGVFKKLPSTNATPAVGDIAAIFIPHEGEEQDAFSAKASEFFSDPQVSSLTYGTARLSESGLMPYLLRYRQSFDINLRKYPAGTRELCFADYAASLTGCYSFIIPAQNIQSVASIAKRSGARVFCTATFTSTNLLRIIDGNETLLSLPLEAALGVCSVTPRTFAINDAPTPFFPRASRFEGRKAPSLLLKERGCDTVSYSSFKSSSATAEVGCGGLRAATYTVLNSLSKLVASGCDRRRAMISCDITASDGTDSERLSETLSLFLGIYRAQTELSLPSSGSKLSFSPELTGAKLAVFATAPEGNTAVADVLQNAEGKIYLLGAAIREDGMPDFENVRKMYDYIGMLSQSGKLLSARALSGELLTDTLGEMVTDSVSYDLLDGVNIRAVSPISIIVESVEPIEGIEIASCCAAKTVAVSESFTDNGDNADTEICSSVYRETPKALILSFGNGTKEAGIICDIFKSYGADASKLEVKEGDRESYGKLSARIREADVTVFTGDSDEIRNALANKRISFALNEYKNDGRLLLSYGEGAASAFAKAGIVELGGQLTALGGKINVRSLNIPSPFGSQKFSYGCDLALGSPVCLDGGKNNAIIEVSSDGSTLYDGFLSSDRLCASFISVLPDEAVRSAVGYFR